VEPRKSLKMMIIIRTTKVITGVKRRKMRNVSRKRKMKTMTMSQGVVAVRLLAVATSEVDILLKAMKMRNLRKIRGPDSKAKAREVAKRLRKMKIHVWRLINHTVKVLRRPKDRKLNSLVIKLSNKLAIRVKPISLRR
jgi:hypothetical protein